ncbi:xanthan lyase [Bacteroides sp. 224]|uniref:golvesin C-terminal-like domain-containing protein n=1 Tax=Bacteroides sp. 224 TaxID=2302936 RepID=UPI0013D6D997|nr:xanthan lyase [Bacteroides sp. 224]NDV64518.1 xanthan lyase [Bacteroides sp. 224]
MSFIHNVQSVAKYESKLLVRSWFFRVFTVLALLILGIYNGNMLLSEDAWGSWMMKAVSSNIPYVSLLLLNTGQAVIAIFLASDFLKRDKKLDTSEVFYVHSLSNAEYVIGKIWGNLRVFLILNLIVLGMTLLFNYMSTGAYVDLLAYLQYFFIICVPTLIFIIGLSIFMMLVLKNQALTFVILLGYIGLTIFYIGNKFYYLFDYMAYSLPLMKSSIVGFTNYVTVLNHRAIYLFAGIAFICLTISLFNRLPNYSRSSYPWVALGVLMLLGSGAAGFNHIRLILHEGSVRKQYTEINNKYVNTPKMVIDKYDIWVEQQPSSITAEVKVKGTALKSSSVFAFCLNPGLQVDHIEYEGTPVKYTRDHQIILADFEKEITQGDSISLTIKYHGKINNDFCYLDIPEEVLQKENKRMLINVDKQYSFQTDNYLLFTPETYWYPRPGISFSDENPDWLQSYFSDFNITIKPLPGLIPLSQGRNISEAEGVYVYSTDYPVQAVSLIIGKYARKSIEADSVLFNAWYIEGHDFFSAELDSIQDTIPHLLKEAKQRMERETKLNYPFKQFSLIEVPAQFHTYVHAWSQSQETMQPEMVLFPEKGWIFDEMDIRRRWKNRIEWSKWDRQIDEYEAKIRTFDDLLYNFMDSEGKVDFSMGQRGRMEITSEANPYYVFPQFYNFRYNIFSSEWSVSNRIVELYLQRKSEDGGWERNYNGISNNEKANLLLDRHSFKELLGDAKYRDIQDNIIGLKAAVLFSVPEMGIGVNAFKDSLYTMLRRNTFKNIQFENLLDTLGHITQTDIRSEITKWNHPTPLPYFTVYPPEVSHIINRGKESFVLKVTISNLSDHDGIVHVNTRVGGYWNDDPDPRASRKVTLKPHETKMLVSVWEEEPRNIEVNTIISNNLPATIYLPVRNIVKENRTTVDEEGDFVIEGGVKQSPNEIIIDNEDPLFSLSEPAIVGLLPKWLDRIEDSGFKYMGVQSWRPPLQWTPTTNGGYYGEYIRSAYVIKSGDGTQTATWKAPLNGAGYYEIYYWAYDSESWNRRHDGKEYHFKVAYNGEEEDAYLNMRNPNGEWEQLGVYYFDTDTVKVTLTNESKIRSVTADAVKIVKRQ